VIYLMAHPLPPLRQLVVVRALLTGARDE